MNQLDVSKQFDKWLVFLGFSATSYKPLELIYYRNNTWTPNSFRGASLILFEDLDGILKPEQINQRCSALFSICLQFFKKKVRGENFIAYIIFPTSSENTDLVNFVTTSRPTSNSLTGTFIPIVMDFTHNSLHFFNPGFSQTTSNANKLGNQIELLFDPPLKTPVDIPERISKLINRLRRSANAETQLFHEEYDSIKIGELKFYSRQWFFEGSLNLDKESDRKLLYSWYLSEFLHSIEKQPQNSKTGLSDELSITSFLSLEQFGIDIITGLARSMVGGFQKGFDQGILESRSSDLRKKLSKKRSITAFAYCHSCDRVVQLTEDGHCDKSFFHKVTPPSYFEVGETDAIQSFKLNGGQDGK